MIEGAVRRLVRIVPETTATNLACWLMEKTRPLPVTVEQREAMRGATRLAYGAGLRQAAWSWGSGPVVLLVHGWGGRAAQMAPLARALARQGFRAIAPDITGHGESPDRRSTWAHFLGDPAQLAAQLREPIHAAIGHSAGGLALMAARSRHGLQAYRYVCICAPSHPYPPITVIRRRLAPPPAVIDHIKHYIAAQFGAGWPALEAARAYAHAGTNLMLIYDRNDRYLDGGDADRIAAQCPGLRRLMVVGYGHQRLLSAPELPQAVLGFIARVDTPELAMP